MTIDALEVWSPLACLQCGSIIRGQRYGMPATKPRFCGGDCSRKWWLDRRRLAGPEVELEGVVGLICAIHAWRAVLP